MALLTAKMVIHLFICLPKSFSVFALGSKTYLLIIKFCFLSLVSHALNYLVFVIVIRILEQKAGEELLVSKGGY